MSVPLRVLVQVPDPFLPELMPPGYEDDDDDYGSDSEEDRETEPFEIDFDGWSAWWF